MPDCHRRTPVCVPGALPLSALLSGHLFQGLRQKAQDHSLCSRRPWCWSAGVSLTDYQGPGNLETIETHSSLFWRLDLHEHGSDFSV